MNNVPASLPDWRPLVLWAVLGIVATYPLYYLADMPHWRTCPELIYIVRNGQEWFVSPFTGACGVAAHGVFIACCLWWRRSRHPFLSVLVPLSSLPCTTFSMHGMWLVSIWMEGGMDWLAFFVVPGYLVWLALCLEWQRTRKAALRVWLAAVMLASSPFGIGFIPALFYPMFFR